MVQYWLLRQPLEGHSTKGLYSLFIFVGLDKWMLAHVKFTCTPLICSSRINLWKDLECDWRRRKKGQRSLHGGYLFRLLLFSIDMRHGLLRMYLYHEHGRLTYVLMFSVWPILSQVMCECFSENPLLYTWDFSFVQDEVLGFIFFLLYY